jgi:FkbM family methyltransferase
MNLLRRTARWVSGTAGRDSALINSLRPAYDRLLDWSTGGRGIVQELNGHERFRIDPRQRVHFPEAYDPAVCSYLRQQVRPGDLCLNVGAHVGVYALCLARWSAPGGRVVAFEPNPSTRAVLQKHVALNDLTERVEVVPQAVSDAVGESTFFAAGLAGFSRLGRPNPERPCAMPITVPVTTLDAFCADHGLVPNWLVMDIEGYEVAALGGARHTVRAGRGRLGIFVEMHPTLWPAAGASRARVEALLAELSLRPVGVAGQADALAEQGMVRLDYV